MTSVLPPPPETPHAESPPGQWVDGLLDRGEVLHVRAAEIFVTAVAGFAINVAFRSSVASAAAMVAGLSLAAVLLVGRRETKRDALVLVAVAIVLCPWLFARSAPALTALTVPALLGTLTMAAALTRSGRLFDLRAREILGHHAAMVTEWAFGIPMVKRAISNRTAGRPIAAGLRGLAIAAPVVLVFALLLASADAVFAKVLVFDNRLGPVAGHVVASVLLTVIALGLVSRAAHETPGSQLVDPPPLGEVEVTVVLGTVIALFGAFVSTQVVAAFGGADHIIETAGLTRAEYARQGFFQLLWVAALALLLLAGLRWLHEHDPAVPRWRFRRLAIGVLALTLVITVISIQRLTLYTEALGLTQKRLWSLAAAAAIGVLIVGYAISLAGVRRSHSWFPGAVIVFGAVFAIAMNMVNPDAFITRYNLTHPPAERAVDITAISRLSDDAVPAAISYRHNLPPAQQAELEALLCRRVDLVTEFGPLGANRARARADKRLDALCPEPRPLPSTRRGD